jgi:hypothetical protein
MLKFVGENYLYLVIGDKGGNEKTIKDDCYVRLYSLKDSKVISDISLRNPADFKKGDQIPFSTLMILNSMTFINIHPTQILKKRELNVAEFDDKVIYFDRGMISVQG